MNRPNYIEKYDEQDLKLGIKSSLPHIKGTLGLSILLWECCGQPSDIFYSMQNNEEIVISTDIKDKVISFLSEICGEEQIEPSHLINTINENQLFKSQLEALIVAFELVWKLAKISFIDSDKPASLERTGGVRYPKKIVYTTNIDIIHSLIENDIKGYIKVLLSWIGINISINESYDLRLKKLLTNLSEGAVFKMADGENDIIFNQNGVYSKILETNQSVDINGDKEAKGSLRILKSLLSDNMNPYIEYLNGNVNKNDENLKNYQKRVETFLRLSSTKVVNTDDEEKQENDEKKPYNENDFLNDVFIDKEELENLLKIIKYNKNVILQGAPGVGKTYIAKRLAYAFMGERDDDRILSIQFHQSYSYEEFIEGIRPDSSGNFRVIPGAFKEFCEKAKKTSEPFFCIVDEINRGNISKILGELMMLIEKDKRGENHKLILPYLKKEFYVPDNIYIIGTMNTADRSIAVIDYALRRRFAFYDNKPYFDNSKFITYINSLNSDKLKNLIRIVNEELNKEIAEDESLGEGFLIGHSYFCGLTNEDLDTRLSQIVNYEIIPSLREYWFDNEEKYNKWKRQLKGAINE